MFLGVGVGLACFGAVLPMLLLYYLLFRSRNCLEKILLMSGLVFFGCLRSSFGFFAVVVFFSSFFLRETAQVVTGHTPTRTCFVCPCSFYCPAAFACSPFLAVRPASWCFPWGAILGPTRFWDSPGTPLRPFLWTRGGKGVLVASFCCFRFPLLLCFAAVFTRTRRGGPVIVRGIPPGHRTRPAPE